MVLSSHLGLETNSKINVIVTAFTTYLVSVWESYRGSTVVYSLTPLLHFFLPLEADLKKSLKGSKVPEEMRRKRKKKKTVTVQGKIYSMHSNRPQVRKTSIQLTLSFIVYPVTIAQCHNRRTLEGTKCFSGHAGQVHFWSPLESPSVPAIIPGSPIMSLCSWWSTPSSSKCLIR